MPGKHGILSTLTRAGDPHSRPTLPLQGTTVRTYSGLALPAPFRRLRPTEYGIRHHLQLDDSRVAQPGREDMGMDMHASHGSVFLPVLRTMHGGGTEGQRHGVAVSDQPR